jgi:hypothetical protein
MEMKKGQMLAKYRCNSQGAVKCFWAKEKRIHRILRYEKAVGAWLSGNNGIWKCRGDIDMDDCDLHGG